jgi:FkbM family methyltransferase
MSVFSPWYVLRPWRLAQRTAFEFGLIPRSVPAKVKLPFGAWIEVDPYRTIGRALYSTRTYDLAMAEVAFRLSYGQSLTVDVGANLGYVTLVMAAALSVDGRCYAFEPVPEIYRQLTRNCSTALNPQLASRIVCHNLALSNKDGDSVISIPADPNEGLASLNHVPGRCQMVDVRCARLDRCFGGNQTIEVLKLDVEGHEFSVLEGAASLLGEGLIRHIIFEDHAGVRSPVIALLHDYGFRIFLVVAGALGPRLIAHSDVTSLPAKSAPNWLATQDFTDVARRVKSRGWRVLGI